MKRDSAIPTPSRGLWRSLICECYAHTLCRLPRKNGMSADNVIYLRSSALDLRWPPRAIPIYTVAVVFALFTGDSWLGNPLAGCLRHAWERSPSILTLSSRSGKRFALPFVPSSSASSCHVFALCSFVCRINDGINALLIVGDVSYVVSVDWVFRVSC